MKTTKTISLFAHTEAGECREASFEEILSAARAMLARRVRRGAPLTSPKLVRDFLAVKLGALEYEVFCCAYVDLCAAPIYVESLTGTAEMA